MRVYLIRHGVTKGNLEHRYVGSTEEVLLPEADEPLLSLKKRLEKDGCRKPHLLVSPMLRCRQSAEILFPGEKQTVVEDFREVSYFEADLCSRHRTWKRRRHDGRGKGRDLFL